MIFPIFSLYIVEGNCGRLAAKPPLTEILAGTPIGTTQPLLGHSTPEITGEIYLHAMPEEQRRAEERVERLVLGPKFGLRR
jgi:integrase